MQLNQVASQVRWDQGYTHKKFMIEAFFSVEMEPWDECLTKLSDYLTSEVKEV